MKNYKFTIKVSDLLHTPGTKDTITFINKFSTFLPHIHKTWISLEMELIWLDDQTILCTIHSGSCDIKTSCDKCGKEFIQDISLPYQEVKCYVEWTYTGDDEHMLISKKDDILHTEKYITDSFLLQQPVINLCKECQQLSTSLNEEDEVITNEIIRK